MQHEEEGVEQPTEQSFDLCKHLRENGLSSQALSKMRKDIDSGDMTVNTLTDCDENELTSISNDYNLTILQKKGIYSSC